MALRTLRLYNHKNFSTHTRCHIPKTIPTSSQGGHWIFSYYSLALQANQVHRDLFRIPRNQRGCSIWGSPAVKRFYEKPYDTTGGIPSDP